MISGRRAAQFRILWMLWIISGSFGEMILFGADQNDLERPNPGKLFLDQECGPVNGVGLVKLVE